MTVIEVRDAEVSWSDDGGKTWRPVTPQPVGWLGEAFLHIGDTFIEATLAMQDYVDGVRALEKALGYKLWHSPLGNYARKRRRMQAKGRRWWIEKENDGWAPFVLTWPRDTP